MGSGADSKPPHGWSLSANKTLTRPFDVLETWMQSLVAKPDKPRDREHYGLTFVLKVKFPPSVQDPAPYLERAWLATRYNHPHLTSHIPLFPEESSSEGQYVTACPLDAPKRQEETSFFVHEGDAAQFKTGHDIIKKFSPSMNATLHWIPGTSELVFCISHRRIDGSGILMLTNGFMSCLCSVIRLGLQVDIKSYQSDVKQRTLHPGAGKPFDPKLDQESVPVNIKKAADELARQFRDSLPSISFPTRPGSEGAAPRDSKVAAITFDAHTARIIRKACADRGLTLAVSMNTSLIRVIASFPQGPRAKNFVGHLVANIRHILGPRYCIPDYALGFFIWAPPFCIPDILGANSSFDKISESVKRVYATNLADLSKDDEGNAGDFTEFLSAYLQREEDLMQQLPSDLPPFRMTALSSTGAVERFLKQEYKIYEEGDEKISVGEPCIGHEILDETPAFNIFSHAGKIRVQVCYNESYYDAEFWDEVFENMKRELFQGLGIKDTNAKL